MIDGQTPVSDQPVAGPVDLLKSSWRILAQRFLTLLGINLIPYLLYIPIFLSLFLVFGVGLVPFYTFKSNAFQSGNIALIAGGTLLAVIFFIAFMVTGLWAQVSLIQAIKDSEEKIGIKEAYRRGWKKLRSIWWINILSGLVILGSLPFFIVPAIILSVWLSFAAFVLVDEEVRGLAALLRSREYIRGKWWAVVGRNAFLLLVSLGLSLAILTLQKALGLVRLNFLAAVPQLLINLFYPIFSVIYTFQLYRAVKSAKAGVTVTEGKSKRWLIAWVILGLLVIPATLFLLATWSIQGANSRLRDAQMKAQEHYSITPIDASEENEVY
jgi:hypothetical protein